jgi:hypothetical protein
MSPARQMKFLGNAFPGDGNKAFKLVDILLRARKPTAQKFQQAIIK